MRRIAKALKGSEGRRTRFHTERGELLPLGGWLSLPRAALRRRGADGPWLVPSAVTELARLLGPESSVVELGAGASTAWLARRAGHVLSFESDPAWHAQVVADLAAAGLEPCEVRLAPAGEFPQALSALPDATVDLVLVDGAEDRLGDRLACVAAARTKVRPGGTVVLDDADRPAYAGADALLPGWEARRFVGVRPSPLVASETAFFRRPAETTA